MEEFSLNTSVIRGRFRPPTNTNSPQNSPWQLAIAKGFAKANSVFIVITSAKLLPRWLFSSKLYIQFTIFIIYFLTKLFTKKRYNLHVLEKSLYVLKQVRSIIFLGSLFIPFLFVYIAMEKALFSHSISPYGQNAMTSHF